MKEQSPSLKEKAARALGIGLVVGAGALPDTRAVQAADIQKHIDSPNKIEQFEKQEMPSANALMEAGFQIGGTQQESASKGQAFRGYEAPSFVKTTEGKVEASQTITETFSGIKLDQPSNKDIKAYFLESNTQGMVQAIYAIVRTTSDNKLRLYKSAFDQSTGKLKKFDAVSQEITIKPVSLVTTGNQVLIGGENPPQSANPALLETEDEGRTFNTISLPISNGVVTEMVNIPITTTNETLLSLPGTETTGSMALYNRDAKTATKVNWNIQGVTTRDGLSLGSTSPDQNTTEAYATALGSLLSQGYIKNTINISMSQSTSEVRRTEWGYLDAFFQLKNDSGNVAKIVATNNARQMLYIEDVVTNSVTEMFFYDWLDVWAQQKNIADYDRGSLRLRSIKVVNNTTWAGGTYQSTTDGESRPVVISWPWGTNPNTNPAVLKVYRLLDRISFIPAQKDMVWGKFNNNYALQIRPSGAGLMVIETAPDGSPLDNPAILYLGNGLGDNPISPTPTPTPERPFRVYVPTLFKNLVTSSWRKVNKLINNK